MSSGCNIWARQFESLLCRKALKKAAERYPEPLIDLWRFPAILAEEKLRKCLESIFFPSEQCLDLLEEWVGEAHAYASLTYSDTLNFCAAVQSGSPPIPEWSDISILTGPAGVGKTAVSEALHRVLARETSFATPDGTCWPLKLAWYVKFRDIKTENGFWKRLGSPYTATHHNVFYARRLAYRLGICRLDLDEMQFYTQSKDANTNITKLLMAVGNLGLPTNVVGNYSLIRRLMKRDSPDQQRLLSAVKVMMPDDPESEDWAMFLSCQKRAVPAVIDIDAKRDGPTINLLSGGQKRAEIRLLLIAYSNKRKASRDPNVTISLADIQRAYDSAQFQFHRDEIEEIARRAITNVSKDDDLSCPIKLPETQLQQFKRRAEQERDSRVARREIVDALSNEDKESLKALSKSSSDRTGSATVRSIGTKRRPKQTLADLARNSANFAENV